MDTKDILARVNEKIIEIAPEAVVVLGTDGKVLEVNNRVYELLGYTREEVVGQSVFLLPYLTVTSKAIVAKNFAKRIAGGDVPSYELDFVTKDGQKKVGKVHAALVRDDADKIIADLVMISDISEQKSATDVVKLEKERTRQYLDLVGVIVVAIGMDEKVLMINKRGVEVLGYNNDTEVNGLNWFDIFMPESIREEMRGHFHEIVKGNLRGRDRIDNPVITRQGQQRIISWHNSYLKDNNGKIIGSVSSGEDVTEKRSAEEKLKESREETEKMNTLMVGREIKMVEMKQRIAELEQIVSQNKGLR